MKKDTSRNVPDFAARESKRLRKVALDAEILAKSESLPDDIQPHAKLSLSSDLKALDGLPIVRPKASRIRHLLSFPGDFKLNSGVSTIGTLADLDTHNPTFYLQFDQGRVKFLGYRQYLKGRILTLECKANELACNDQFDSLIVFSEYYWVGTKLDNPGEKPLPFPTDVLRKLQEVKVKPDPKSSVELPRPNKNVRRRVVVSSDEEGSDTSMNDPSESQRSRPKRGAASNVSYIEKSEDEEAEEDDIENLSDSSVEKPKAKKPRKSEKAKMKKDPIVVTDSDDEIMEVTKPEVPKLASKTWSPKIRKPKTDSKSRSKVPPTVDSTMRQPTILASLNFK
eukprot:m.94969 g.94969  ORF g.94969 m.94969 type:complete len:338 (-) comp13471_c0_seq1:1084-2097(-)